MTYHIILIFLAFVSYSAEEDSLTVMHTNRILYSGDSGLEAVVDHYLLSDSSLYFIKLFYSGVEYTLPQTVSGSGARFSSGMDITWWERADSAMVQERDSLGNWETTAVLNVR